MKNLKFVFGMFACAALMTACSNNDNGLPTASYLKIDVTNPINKEATSQDFEIPVSTDAEALNVEVSYEEETTGDWCTATFADQTLSVHLNANNVLTERIATVKLSITGADPVSVTIVQAAAAADKDPFEPENYPFEWNNSWTVDNFVYDYGATWKYEPISWGEKDVPNCSGNMYVSPSGQEISIGLKLEAPVLAKFGGKRIAKIECLTYVGITPVAKLALVKSTGPTPNAGDMPSYVKETYSASEVLWEGDVNVSDNGWAVANISDDNIIMPADGNVFVLAYLSGDGNMIPADGGGFFSKFYYVWQTLNPFAPSYINFDNSQGQKMYKFLGGTVDLNFSVESGK